MKNQNALKVAGITLPKLYLILLSFISFAYSNAQTHTPITAHVTDNINGYWEYLPADYNTSGKNYPVMIFLHGIGEVGDGSTSSLQTVLRNGPPQLISNKTFPTSFTVNGQTFSFIVISPQFTNTTRSPKYINDLIDYCISKYRIDKSRIYLTGLSFGGGTCTYYASTSVDNSKRLAALLAVSGNCKIGSTSSNVIAANLPFWATTNESDPTVSSSISKNWANGLNSANPAISPKALLNVFPVASHDSWTQTYDPNWRPNGLNVYEWMLSYTRGTSSSVIDAPPVATITGTTSITLPANTVTLDGSTSKDNDGSIKSYLWSYVSGPTGYTLGTPTSSKSTISGLVAGTYVFKLTVTDDKGISGTASYTIVVNSISNAAPVAVIKGTTNITLPISSIKVDGSSSTDADGTIKSYLWSYVSGPAGYLMGAPASAISTVSGLIAGKYVFKLTVTDDKGATGSTNVAVTVNPLLGSVIPIINQAPVVVISAPGTVYQPATSINLDGSASKDNDGTIAKYNWSRISGPGGFSYGGSVRKPQVTVKGLKIGNYVFQLTVTDNKGLASALKFTFAVKAAASGLVVAKPSILTLSTLATATAVANQAPVSTINGPSVIYQPATSINLDGSASKDNDGTITKYNWSRISGPGGFSYGGSVKTSKVTVNGLKLGTYVFRLTTTDDKGATGSSNFTFNVKVATTAPVNAAPIATISANNTLTLPVNSAILDGSGSKDNDGTIKSYVWNYVSGPLGYSLSGQTTAKLSVGNLSAGTYAFKLTVTDNSNATASTTATITVNAAVPTVPAGDCGCTKTVTVASGQGLSIDGNALGIKPGNIICVKAGNYKFIKIYNVKGTAASPVIFKNCGGQVVISGNTATNIAIYNSNNLKITGTGSADKYGFKTTSSSNSVYSGIGLKADYMFTDIEVDHLEIYRSSIGFVVRTEPSCDPLTWKENGTIRNVSLHDNYVHQTTNEGFYCGFTGDTKTIPCSGVNKLIYAQPIKGMKIYNNITDSTGWDGIQVGLAPENVAVYNNKVTNFGTVSLGAQQAGIIFNPGSTGSLFNNIIMNGPGAGIQIMGQGRINIYNNLVYNVGGNKADLSNFGQSGIIVADRPPHEVPLTVFISNNTIVSPKRYGIYLLNPYGTVGSDNYIYNNIIVMDGTHNYNMGAAIESQVKYSASNNISVNTIAEAKFANAAQANFKLTASSPAINAGKDLSSFNLTSLTSDLLYVLRPTGVCDAGAYEYSGSSSKTVAVNTSTSPTAVLAKDVTVDIPNNLVTQQTILDGTKSYAGNGAKITNYQWSYVEGTSKDFKLLNIDKSQVVLNNLSEGVYTFELKVTDNNNLSDSTKVRIIAKKNLTAGLTVGPVPARDNINVYLNGNTKGKVSIRIMDNNGRPVVLKANLAKDFAQWQNNVDISRLTQGVYYIEVILGNEKYTSKFIKAQ